MLLPSGKGSQLLDASASQSWPPRASPCHSQPSRPSPSKTPWLPSPSLLASRGLASPSLAPPGPHRAPLPLSLSSPGIRPGAPEEGPTPSKNAPIQAPILAQTRPFMPIQTLFAHSRFFLLPGGYHFSTEFAHSASPQQFYIILGWKIEGGGPDGGHGAAAERRGVRGRHAGS